MAWLFYIFYEILLSRFFSSLYASIDISQHVLPLRTVRQMMDDIGLQGSRYMNVMHSFLSYQQSPH